MINDYLEQNGLKLTSFMEISSSDASKELIKLGLGVGVMADWLVANEVASGDLVSLPLGFGKLTRTWGISIRKGRKLNKAERIFIKIAEESGCHWMVNRRLTP
jgi:DNA-binding transcriptional LysR family regulator